MRASRCRAFRRLCEPFRWQASACCASARRLRCWLKSGGFVIATPSQVIGKLLRLGSTLQLCRGTDGSCRPLGIEQGKASHPLIPIGRS